jgi:hypothetical protein
VELNVPVELVVNVIVPVGATAPVPEESATVAVQVVVVPVLTGAGEHETVVEEDLIVEVKLKVPLLPPWLGSPP